MCVSNGFSAFENYVEISREFFRPLRSLLTAKLKTRHSRGIQTMKFAEWENRSQNLSVILVFRQSVIRYPLFRDFPQGRTVISYGPFGVTYQSHLQGPYRLSRNVGKKLQLHAA